MSFAEISEYKGNPVLTLKNDPDDRYPFTFGVKKAKLLLEHLDDIRKFVADHESKAPKAPPSEK